jgi:hypothetical protein
VPLELRQKWEGVYGDLVKTQLIPITTRVPCISPGMTRVACPDPPTRPEGVDASTRSDLYFQREYERRTPGAATLCAFQEIETSENFEFSWADAHRRRRALTLDFNLPDGSR